MVAAERVSIAFVWSDLSSGTGERSTATRRPLRRMADEVRAGARRS